MIPGSFPIAGRVPYRAQAVSFDGNNDWLTRSTLVGSGGTSTLTYSFWVKFLSNGADGNDTIFTTYGFFDEGLQIDCIIFRASADGTLRTTLRGNQLGQVRVSFASNTVFSNNIWYHILFSVTTGGDIKLYINDVLDAATPSTNSGNIRLDAPEVFIGAGPTGGNESNIELAEFYLGTTYYDLTQVSNRRRFISASGKPVKIPDDGLISLRGPFSQFANNFGTGGAFTVVGNITDAASSPSD